MEEQKNQAYVQTFPLKENQIITANFMKRLKGDYHEPDCLHDTQIKHINSTDVINNL